MRYWLIGIVVALMWTGVLLAKNESVRSTLWRFQKGNGGYLSSVSFKWQPAPQISADGTVYVQNGWDGITAIDNNGRSKWVRQIPDQTLGDYFAVTPSGTLFYMVTNLGPRPIQTTGGMQTQTRIPVDSTLFAIDQSGNELWKKQIASTYWEHFVYFEGNKLLVSSDRFLLMFDEGGTELFNYSTVSNATIYGATLGFDGTVYSGTAAAQVIALNPDGHLKWESGGNVGSTPVLGHNGDVYVYDGMNYISAYSPTGEWKWMFDLKQPSGGDYKFLSSPGPAIGEGGTLYLGTDNGKLFAISPEGQQLWVHKAKNSISRCVVAGDGTIYFSVFSTGVFGISDAGKVVWSWLDPGTCTAPTLGKGNQLYVGTSYHVYALEIPIESGEQSNGLHYCHQQIPFPITTTHTGLILPFTTILTTA